MSDVIYGRNPILEALKAKQKLQKILIAENAKGARISEILSLARANRVRIQKVPAQKIVELTGKSNAQGLAALTEPHRYASLDDILEQAIERNEPPLIALLDGIEDPHNLGAILRSADGAGVHGIVLPKRRSVGLTASVAKTSAGAMAHVLTAQVANLANVIEKLKRQDVWIVGADENGTQDYFEADLSAGLAIVIGNEGTGLHRLVKEKCDFLVRIPMHGKINSLNAAVAAALLFFEARRQRQLNAASS